MWQLIQNNNGCGLGNLDEAGMEACNKELRSNRKNLSRKSSQEENLTDTLNRMWLGTDPIVNYKRLQARPKCKKCQISGHKMRHCPQSLVYEVSAEEDSTFFSFISSE